MANQTETDLVQAEQSLAPVAGIAPVKSAPRLKKSSSSAKSEQKLDESSAPAGSAPSSKPDVSKETKVSANVPPLANPAPAPESVLASKSNSAPKSDSASKPDESPKTATQGCEDSKPQESRKPPLAYDGQASPFIASIPNFEKLSVNMGRLAEQGSRVMAAYLRPFESGKSPGAMGDEVADAVKTLGKVAEYWMSDPQRMLQAQTALSTSFIDLWGNTLRRMTGETVQPVVPVDPRDKRFSDPQWQASPVFDFIRQAYSMTVSWAHDLVDKNDEVDQLTRSKAAFYVRQLAGALSPSNFVGTNPELLRMTLDEEGENLVRGLNLLAEDIEAGEGSLKLRQSDSSKFTLGVNMAISPGKVVWRNDLIELIQYAPATEKVYKRPLLIVPPWINKFYILDLNPEKSFIRWAVAQGLTVFIVSWVNPDSRHADKGFAEYMHEGVLEPLDVIEKITGEKQVTSIGYCVGGTLMATTLAYMTAKGDDRITSSTLFTTQVDFTDPGDLKVFTDAETIRNVDERMAATGFLDGSRMANAFNMLRPNDLIWSYVVNNYLRGKAPLAFDLLTWNSDSTRMTRANHMFYLCEYYLENNLAKGKLVIDGVKVDLKQVQIPIYNLAAKEDHIAPAKSVFTGAKLFGGPVRYVLAGSGHIAGVVNPPYQPKYQYWTGGAPSGEFADWIKSAKETPGSWWLDWIEWIKAQAPEMVEARQPGGGKTPLLGDAPGGYVRIKV